MPEPTPTPLNCWTCRHRRKVEIDTGMCLYTGIFHNKCKACRHDLLGSADMMDCGEAYDEFCGGGDWEPDFWSRVVNLFTGHHKYRGT